ncbi:hypothetical protein N7468_000488 [Penicillium chermesinum]|uniref:Methionine aminopeptidase 2 n=1 Tax=Penicillium chermesinum TaxID=63820 RepID=A0A9W9TYG4_9EURO|nr:uncharacterized protein N7468_000488 [Penicillium chermesinum]KAJ5249037.1 hypothetical protein N7468_000488 [Penicillium chermesinum]
MGAKSPEHESQNGGNDPSNSANATAAGGEPRGTHLSRDGDGSLGDGDSDDDGGDGDEAGAVTGSLTSQPSSSNASKKKRRKKPKKKAVLKQSFPPRVPLDQLFPSGEFPAGEIQEYASPIDTTARTPAEEKRYEARRQAQDDTWLQNYRKAAEVHRQVRHWVQETARPGTTLTELAVGIEDGVRALLDNPGLETGSALKSGLGFPPGLALNHCVAHFTPNPGQPEVVLKSSDVMKVDFGVHINGWIVDSAFTMSFDPIYDNLLTAVKDSTNTGIRNAGVDVRISDVSAAIQEVMESYEVEIGGKVFPVKPVRNITGHNIKPYKIHAGKSVPFVKTKDQTKMEEGEVFAIETFGTTGRGYTVDGTGVYGYGKDYEAPKRVVTPFTSAKALYKKINENFGTIVFNRRSLERLGGVMDVYPPLMDIEGSYSAQFEHTVLLGPCNKEVISRGTDY